MKVFDTKSILRIFLLVTIALIVIPLLFRIRITIPLISLMLSELAILYLSALLYFPHITLAEIIKRGTIYLFFVACVFTVLSFVPFSHRLIKFIYDSSGHWFGMVTVNLVGFFVLNLMTNLLIGNQIKILDQQIVSNGNTRSLPVFDNTKTLEGNQGELISLFDKQESNLFDLGLGKLSQFLFKYNGEWNLVAKAQDQYFISKTESDDIDNFLSTAAEISQNLKGPEV